MSLIRITYILLHVTSAVKYKVIYNLWIASSIRTSLWIKINYEYTIPLHSHLSAPLEYQRQRLHDDNAALLR